MRLYPATRPSDLAFTAGEFSVSPRKHVGVVEYPDLRGSIPVGAMLEMSYQNIDDALAAAIVESYKASLSGFLSVTVQRPMLRGVRKKELISLILEPRACAWHFNEEPRVESVSLGISTVPSVKLITKPLPIWAAPA